ncbi:MAG TPA: aldo/keto reductase [Succinivibrionaceae bacterium]|nr:aldo/keto reductase [Succinivibrionaceae bacterium]
MFYRELGTSGIKVSAICAGCMSFGKPSEDFHLWTLDEKNTSDMVGKALDCGINFFDTANVYSHGTSEEYLGKALKNKIPRDQVVIATKVFFNEGHLSKKAIRREIEGSLRRLDTDYVDLYIIHRYDHQTPPLETMQTLHELIKEGKVRALGASAMYGYEFMNLQNLAKSHELTPFVSMQNHYNLIYREDERELIPVCKQFKVTLTPYSPLAGGHLSRPQWNSDSMRSRTDKTSRQKYDRAMAQDLPIIERVQEIAHEHALPMATVALAWLLAKPWVSAPIVGATSQSHIEDACKATELNLTDEEKLFLEELYTAHEVVGALPAV